MGVSGSFQVYVATVNALYLQHQQHTSCYYTFVGNILEEPFNLNTHDNPLAVLMLMFSRVSHKLSLQQAADNECIIIALLFYMHRIARYKLHSTMHHVAV